MPARVLIVCPASMSQCRAAGGRWRAGALPALEIHEWHQSRERLHALGLTRKDLPSVDAPTAERLRTRKPIIYAGVALSAVVAAQTRHPEAQAPQARKKDGPAAGRWLGDTPPP